TAHYALSPQVEPEPTPEWEAAKAEVDALIADLGWQVAPGAPARNDLTQTVARMRRLGMGDAIRTYAETAERLVRQAAPDTIPVRSEERRVGKDGRYMGRREMCDKEGDDGSTTETDMRERRAI